MINSASSLSSSSIVSLSNTYKKSKDPINYNLGDQDIGLLSSYINHNISVLIKEFPSNGDLNDLKLEVQSHKIIIYNMEPFFINYHDKIMHLRQTLADLRRFISSIGWQMGRIGEYFLVLASKKYISIKKP